MLGDFHLETIWRTNMGTAYGVGRRRSMEEVSDLLPFWERVAVGDDRTRPAHMAIDGVILPADDPFWIDHYPPDGFNCRCTVIARLDMPAGYNRTQPNPETTIAYDDDGQPWKAEYETRVVDLTAVQFEGVPPMAKLDDALARNVELAITARKERSIEFSNYDNATRWAESHFKSSNARISNDEREALGKYTGFYYEDINHFIRTGEPLRPDVVSKKLVAEQLKLIDRAISKGATPKQNLIVYRGLRIEPDGVSAFITGKEIITSGYFSTSLIRKIAKGFADRAEGMGLIPCLIKLHVSNEKAAYLDPISTLPEAEILFARNSKLRIMSVENRKNGSLFITARLQK